MVFEKLASAIHNDILSGLRGYHSNLSLSLEQLEDDIIDARLQIIKEYNQKGILPYKELALSINCIPVDCKSLDSCSKCFNTGLGTEPTAHFEIPQFIELIYVGSIDKQTPFIIYTSSQAVLYNKYRKRGKTKPYVFVDITPNENGMNDVYIFNAPLIKQVSVVAVFKDPRQLEEYGCCVNDDNMSFINNEIKKRVTEQKLRYYRQYAAPLKPNDQTINPG
jgi:hypothetical protein